MKKDTLLVTVDYSIVLVECVPGEQGRKPVPRGYSKNVRWYHPDIHIFVAMRHGAPLQWERANAAIQAWLQDNHFPVAPLRYNRTGRKRRKEAKIDGIEQLELL